MALRTPLSVTPHLYMGDSTGRPLDNGVVYFGEQDKDPEYYPITLYSDDALTLPLMQPVHTKGGYLYDKGDMVEPHAKEIIYSVKVLDSYGRKVFYKGAMMRNSWNDDVIVRIDEAITTSSAKAVTFAEKAINDAIDNTAIEGSVLTDTLLVATSDGAKRARTQRDKNSDSTTPYDFGVVGGTNEEKLSDRFATLVDAQAVYPLAVSLDELADRVAFDAFLSYLINNDVTGADWGCDIAIDQPLISYTDAKTLSIKGDLKLTAVVHRISHAFHIATKYLNWSGTIYCLSKTVDSMQSRELVHGVVMASCYELGLPSLNGQADNGHYGNIIGYGLLGSVFVGGQNAHFTRVGTVRGLLCGSALKHPSAPFSQGMWDTVTPTGVTGGDISQRQALNLDTSNLDKAMFDAVGGVDHMVATINNKPYDILSLDVEAGTAIVYPALPESERNTQTTITYHFGGVVHMGVDGGNNTSATSFGTIQGIVCGVTLAMRTLYGSDVSVLSSENSGVGIIVGNRSKAHIGTHVSLGYFENNSHDIMYMWSGSTGFVLEQTIALNLEKVWQMFAYTIGENRRGDWLSMNDSRLGDVYQEPDVTDLSARSYNQTELYSVSRTYDYYLTIDYKKALMQKMYSKPIRVVRLGITAPVVIFHAPDGWTINGQPSMTVSLADYKQRVFDIQFIWDAGYNFNIQAYILGDLL